MIPWCCREAPSLVDMECFGITWAACEWARQYVKSSFVVRIEIEYHHHEDFVLSQGKWKKHGEAEGKIQGCCKMSTEQRIRNFFRACGISPVA